MGRTLNQVIAELPPERRERVEARYRELKQEVEGLRELREIAGKAQLDVAAALRIKQPSVSKIEKQTDMYLSDAAQLHRGARGKTRTGREATEAACNPTASARRRLRLFR
jgi:transcriptional regulator with XRE-family HTH domain